MKKVFLILITLFIFVGCANSPNDDSYTLDESKDYFDGLYDWAFDCSEMYSFKFYRDSEENKIHLELYDDKDCKGACIDTQILTYEVTDKYAILSSSEVDDPKTLIKLNPKTKTFEKAIIFYNNKTFDISEALQPVASNLKY